MSILSKNFLLEHVLEHKGKKEIPCKDMDLDCLPDRHNNVPFGNYKKCFAYDPLQGTCPFLPMED